MKLLKFLFIAAVAIVACFLGSGHGDFRGTADVQQRAKSAFGNLADRFRSIVAGERAGQAGQPQISDEMPRLVSPGPLGNRNVVDLAKVDHDKAPAVARAFMESIKLGDASTAGELLTFAAKHALAGEGLQPVGKGDPAAFFHIGATEYGEGNQTAHVACTWTDAGSLSIVLRREVPGWRVAGIVHQNGQGDVYSFESPKSMVR